MTYQPIMLAHSLMTSYLVPIRGHNEIESGCLLTKLIFILWECYNCRLDSSLCLLREESPAIICQSFFFCFLSLRFYREVFFFRAVSPVITKLSFSSKGKLLVLSFLPIIGKLALLRLLLSSSYIIIKLNIKKQRNMSLKDNNINTIKAVDPLYMKG